MHDNKTPPGQVKYPEENSYRHGPARPKRLGDYIKQVQESEERTERLNASKKLTFDEWLHQSSFVKPDAGMYNWLKDAWNAGQEQGFEAGIAFNKLECLSKGE